mmetsp:Transcript_22505/g.49240  ORF Transcript_22505/g.49240 Transcript_22505/m.49240 type:complete len:86 (-) Transcript_22505:153-410(-)
MRLAARAFVTLQCGRVTFRSQGGLFFLLSTAPTVLLVLIQPQRGLRSPPPGGLGYGSDCVDEDESQPEVVVGLVVGGELPGTPGK